VFLAECEESCSQGLKMVCESTHCKTKSIRRVQHFLVNASNVEMYLEINYVTPLIYKTTVYTVFVM